MRHTGDVARFEPVCAWAPTVARVLAACITVVGIAACAKPRAPTATSGAPEVLLTARPLDGVQYVFHSDGEIEHENRYRLSHAGTIDTTPLAGGGYHVTWGIERAEIQRVDGEIVLPPVTRMAPPAFPRAITAQGQWTDSDSPRSDDRGLTSFSGAATTLLAGVGPRSLRVGEVWREARTLEASSPDAAPALGLPEGTAFSSGRVERSVTLVGIEQHTSHRMAHVKRGFEVVVTVGPSGEQATTFKIVGDVDALVDLADGISGSYGGRVQLTRTGASVLDTVSSQSFDLHQCIVPAGMDRTAFGCRGDMAAADTRPRATLYAGDRCTERVDRLSAHWTHLPDRLPRTDLGRLPRVARPGPWTADVTLQVSDDHVVLDGRAICAFPIRDGCPALVRDLETLQSHHSILHPEATGTRLVVGLALAPDLPLRGLRELVAVFAQSFPPVVIVERADFVPVSPTPTDAPTYVAEQVAAFQHMADSGTLTFGEVYRNAVGYCSAMLLLGADRSVPQLKRDVPAALRQCACEGVDVDVIDALLTVVLGRQAPQGTIPWPTRPGARVTAILRSPGATVADLAHALVAH